MHLGNGMILFLFNVGADETGSERDESDSQASGDESYSQAEQMSNSNLDHGQRHPYSEDSFSSGKCAKT